MSGSTLPTVMTPTGLQPQTPAALNALIYNYAQGLSPGLTVLPGGLISDLGGTGTGAALVMDQARVDVINSVSPLGANPFLLYQLGAIYGVPPGQTTNASVYVVFTGSAAGIVIPIGFTVSDGSRQYTVQDGGITGSSLQTPPLYCLATQPGIFPILPGTVTQLVTSAPTGYTLTCTNPLAGTPQQLSETIAQYRANVLQAGQVASVGTAPFLKTLLTNVPGVNPNLISVPVAAGSGWKVIVGGSGDPYQIAYAIFQAVGDPALLVGSTLGVANFTAAANGIVTTTLNHGYATGQAVTIAGVAPAAYNGNYTITVLTETTFEVNVNTSTCGAYSSGGVVTPNFRNQSITVINYPDSYTIPFVTPPAQTVAMAVTWNTISLNYVSTTAVAQLASNALANYVNLLGIGQPLNVDVMIATFQTAVAAILPAQLLSTVTFSVTINGVSSTPSAGTVLIYGDPESYFTTTAAAIVVEKAT
jgi:hypothetical protein